jgi:hypothetical protein
MRHQIALFISLLLALPAFAGQPESEDAVTNILFDENMENVSYSFRSDGFVDILFGVAVPEPEYIRIVERMRKHPDIPGVLSGRGKGNYCPVPN